MLTVGTKIKKSPRIPGYVSLGAFVLDARTAAVVVAVDAEFVTIACPGYRCRIRTPRAAVEGAIARREIRIVAAKKFVGRS